VIVEVVVEFTSQYASNRL